MPQVHHWLSTWIFEMAIQLHKSIQAFRAFRRTLPHGTSVGFVPTMGALHDGELENYNYILYSREEADVMKEGLLYS